MTGILRNAMDKEVETRAKWNALAADAQESDRNEAQKALDAASLELRSALKDEPIDPLIADAYTQDAETREQIELRAKTGVADFLKAAAGGTSVVGAAAEYADACGVPTSGHLPMALFAPTAPTNTHLHIPTVETRAVTPGPAVKGILQPTVPYIFERSAAASLGISMPMVPSGQVQIPKITTAPPADTLAQDGAAPATAAAITLVNQSPERIAGSFEVRVEDLAVMPSMESALSESLQGSLSNELDEQTFNGAAGELDGLFTQATDATAASAVETYTSGIKRFAELVDGKHAYTLADVRAVIGSKSGPVRQLQ